MQKKNGGKYVDRSDAYGFPMCAGSTSNRPEMRGLKPAFNKVGLLDQTKAHVTLITLRRFAAINTQGNQRKDIQNIKC